MLLDNLDSIDWTNIHHSHGTAEKFPVWIRQLVSDDPKVRESARENLFEFSHHQGSIYEVSAHIVPFFLELLAHKDTPEKAHLLYHLSSLASGSRRSVVENVYGGNEKVTYRNINKGLPLYLELLQDSDPQVRLEAFRTIVSVEDPDLSIKDIPRTPAVIRALIACVKSETNPSVKAEMIEGFSAFSDSLRFVTLHEEYEDLRALLLVLARDDPDPKVKFNAAKSYLDLLLEKPDEAQFIDNVLRDVLINPEEYWEDDPICVELTLKYAIDYISYLPRMTRLTILADALNKSRYPSDAHIILQALLDTIFFGFVRADHYSYRTKPVEIRPRLVRRRLEDEDPAERPDNCHVSFRTRFKSEQETRQSGWFYLSSQPPMNLRYLSAYERQLLEQALTTELAWMLHSNILATYGLPVTRVETWEYLNKATTTKSSNGHTRN